MPALLHTSGLDNADETRERLRETGLTIGDVLTRAPNGDERARTAFDDTAHFLALGLAMIINALNPLQIVPGGEITADWSRIEPIVREMISQRALTTEAAATPIIPEDSAVSPRLRGATALVAAPLFAAPKVA